MALAMLECGPPTEHRSGAQMTLLADGTYHLAVGSTEMGNGSVTSHRQIAAAFWAARADARSTSSTPTPIKAPYDTGTFASTGTVVAGQAVALTAAALRDNILELRQPPHGRRPDRLQARRRNGDVRQPPDHADRPPRRRHQGRLATSRPGAGRISRRAPSRSTSRASVWRCIA